jgi:hypothetical protein
MTRLNQLATLGPVIAVALVANVSSAAPLSHGASAIIEGTATLNLIEQAHGTHRACARGWVNRWGVVRWHRHRGRTNLPLLC